VLLGFIADNGQARVRKLRSGTEAEVREKGAATTSCSSISTILPIRAGVRRLRAERGAVEDASFRAA